MLTTTNICSYEALTVLRVPVAYPFVNKKNHLNKTQYESDAIRLQRLAASLATSAVRATINTVKRIQERNTEKCKAGADGRLPANYTDTLLERGLTLHHFLKLTQPDACARLVRRAASGAAGRGAASGPSV